MAAPGFDVLGRKQRLLPGFRGVVRFTNARRSTLPSMTQYAAELRQRMRDYRMLAIRSGHDIRQGSFFQPEVARGAAVHDFQFRMPDLLYSGLNMALKRHSVGTGTNELQITILIMAPFTEVILRWSDSK